MSNKILGLSFFYHDSAAALLVDGVPVAMAEEERFSRKKHDSEFPELAIEFVLKKAGITAVDLDYIVFYEKPFLKMERIFKTLLGVYPFSPWLFLHSVKNLFLSKIWIRELIVRKLRVDPKKVLFVEHHYSHAASAFLCSPFNEAAILTIDGVGEWATTTIGSGKDNRLNISRQINFPHSWGLVYSAFTAFLGFEVNEGEYKVMGMAPYGQPKYVEKVRRIFKMHPDNSFELDLSYFDFQHSTKRTFSNKFIELFGKPRQAKSKFFTRLTGWPTYFGSKPEAATFAQLAEEQEYYADIAASIQAVTEEVVVALAKEAKKLTGLSKLCIAGGVGLNSVANSKVLAQSGFDELYIQPAAGDGGASLGCALFVHHVILNNPRAYVMDRADFGQEFSDQEIEKFLKENNIQYEQVADNQTLVNCIADELDAGKVIGWFQGRFEWGPRALGNRSIIADPRRAEMKDVINNKIKFREPYRPFAPSILAEHAQEYFEMDPNKQFPARFMLLVVNVKEDKKKVIPAVTHVDGTGRVQTVYSDSTPLYHQLIQAFYKKTGVPVILDTSFNLKGEPIVTTPANAYSTFSKSGLDLLVMNRFIVKK